ncbi:unnamed protein product [Cylindrotheca closterium]|uniref:Uncharacterized protein n=1 Tax=Cylindrotheca closterium TaxID=2856 RepID=A0AAD2FLD3_9STRA|nr:unnamed protein product [Cylindrotheca closterium]
MALEITVNTQLLQDLYYGGHHPVPKGAAANDKENAKPKEHPPPSRKPEKWALESPRKEIKQKMKRTLRSLQNSDSEIEAQCAIASLCYQASFDGDSRQDDKIERKLCRRLFRLKAIPVLLKALEKWRESLCFASQTVILLIKITYFEPNRSLTHVLEHNGIPLLLNIGTHYHQDDLNLSADILLVLENLSRHDASRGDSSLEQSRTKSCCPLDGIMKKVLATSDCIDFVATKMHDYPHDDILQRNACGYLENIGYFAAHCSHHHKNNYKNKLHKRGIPYLLEKAIDNFWYSNTRVASQAREALCVIDNLYHQQYGAPVE